MALPKAAADTKKGPAPHRGGADQRGVVGVLDIRRVGGDGLNGNVCWQVKERYAYPKKSGVIIHEGTWKPGPNVVVREPREGRGYWKGEVWTAL